MKYMKNPVTGEIMLSSPLHAKKLQRYGWSYATKSEWVDYTRAKLHLAMARNIPQLRVRVH